MDHMGGLFLTLEETMKLSSKAAIPVYIPVIPDCCQHWGQVLWILKLS